MRLNSESAAIFSVRTAKQLADELIAYLQTKRCILGKGRNVAVHKNDTLIAPKKFPQLKTVNPCRPVEWEAPSPGRQIKPKQYLNLSNIVSINIHSLLTIADFVVRFLAIHPFQDGNGRLSRILTNLLLLRNGYTFIQYSSHERVVEANKDNYYLALKTSQEKLKSQKDFSLTWVEFFLELLKKQKDDLKTKIEQERKAHRTPELSEKICSLANDHSRITVAFITNGLQANRNTVKKHLQNLVKIGRLVKHGKGRGAYYSLF